MYQNMTKPYGVVRAAALAYASGDHETFDEVLVYLTGGKVTPGLRKIGVLQPIDAKNGSLALRTLAVLIRRMGWSGFALILDEGDRSLSIVSSKDRKAASNNLVQLINEAATEGAWPGTLLLYSIPSWQNFSQAFDQNQALIQRTSKTGFPLVPPAPRIVLDERELRGGLLRSLRDAAVLVFAVERDLAGEGVGAVLGERHARDDRGGEEDGFGKRCHRCYPLELGKTAAKRDSTKRAIAKRLISKGRFAMRPRAAPCLCAANGRSTKAGQRCHRQPQALFGD